VDANLRVILQQLEAEKSIDRQTLLSAICIAIESAARKSLTHVADVSVEVDPNTLEFKVFEIRNIVETIQDPSRDMLLQDALELNPNVVIGNRLKVPVKPKDFGRIAAQTAKQVIIQKIKDAERDNVYEEFKQRQGELITGIVKRVNHGNVIVAIGKAEAILPHREQSPRENFKPGDRIRAYLLEVDKSGRGAQLLLSRTVPDLVRGLFELEVPEIYDGTIEIKAVAREPGSRTKVAVMSHDPNVDPVGACVGMKGSRVRTVVEDLCGEKIDIVRWSAGPVEFCANALNPADILDISIDEEKREIRVVVPHDQLSLAIGKRGQNARLASKLIGWNIDIRSDQESAGAELAELETMEPTVCSEDDLRKAPYVDNQGAVEEITVAEPVQPESAVEVQPEEDGS
jgi:N utilization substance protein A